MTSRYLAILLCLSSPAHAEAEEMTEAFKQAAAAIEAGDFPKAAELLNRDADAGNPVAHLRLGELYLRGAPGVEPDQDRGLFHLQSAAEAGLPEASALLGNLSQSNAEAADAKPERERLFKEARVHFEKAVLQSHPGSQLALAYLLDSGQGGNIDAPRALSLIQSAAHAGNAEAMNELGLRHQSGNGVAKDAVTALGWFVAGAERNNPAAMTNLGISHSKGIVLPVNFDKAGSWFAQAAKLNYAPAQYFLGEAFEKGLGTEANPAFAFVNYTRAAKAHHLKAAQALDALTPKLTPDQKEEALKILSEKP